MKVLTLPNIYSQQDNRWAKELLGHNTDPKYDIYNYGCLITCLAMISSYYGVPHNPSTMNKILKENGGFSNGGFYNWGTVKKLNLGVTEEEWVGTPMPLTDSQMQKIKSAIDSGYPVMLQIDYDPKDADLDMHYVLGIGYNSKDENDILIADPIGGVQKSLKKYLGWFRPSARRSIEQYIVYKGTAVLSTEQLLRQIAELKTALESLQDNTKKQLLDKDKECQNKILSVKNKLFEVVNSL